MSTTGLLLIDVYIFVSVGMIVVAIVEVFRGEKDKMKNDEVVGVAIPSTLGRVRQAQAEKWGEVVRLAQRCAQGRSRSEEERLARCADLLAEIGVIHPTLGAKRDWIEGRE